MLLTGSGLLTAAPVAHAASPTDWYLSVGPWCNGGILDEVNWCGPQLVARDPDFRITDRLRWSSNSLTGPNGPVPLRISSAFTTGESGWGKRPPATDYIGSAYYNQAPTGLPPGDYTYSLTVNIAGQWKCSVYDPDGCSWLKEDKIRYDWRFTWDGTSTTLVAPTWTLIVNPTRMCGQKGCATVVTYGANVPMLAPITLQRRSAGAPWKTIDTTKTIDYGGWFFDESAKKGKTYQYRIVTSDPTPQMSKPVKFKL
jgi:hypothetical protein